MNRHERRLGQLAKIADGIEPVAAAKIVAAVVRKNDIIGFGTNLNKSDPLQARFAKNPSAIYLHAEIAALKHALKTNPLSHVRGSTLYIARARLMTCDDGFMSCWGNSKPCVGCQRALNLYKIKNVFYTLDSSDLINKTYDKL
jgi:tRNA(Arg) A34 adenosine deaminase TadA